MRSVLMVLEATTGGTRRHLRDLALGLVSRGWRVDVAYANLRDKTFGEDLEIFREADIGLHEIRMKRGFSPVTDLLAIMRLRRILKVLSPEILHLHSTKAGFVGRLALIGNRDARRVRCVYTPHCFAFKMSGAATGLYRWCEKLLVRFVDLLIGVCAEEVREAHKLGYENSRIRLIYNGIDDATLLSKPLLREAHSVAFIGRSARQKGLDLFIAALSILRKRGVMLTPYVMSDPSEAEAAKLRLLGACMLPFSRQDVAFALLQRIELLIMPSRWEAFPYLLLEAFAAGTAVVASNVGGVAECASGAAELTAPDAPVELADAAERLLGDAASRAELVCRGLVRLKLFTLERMLNETILAYESVLSPRA